MFRYPNFSASLNVGAPIFDPGEPKGTRGETGTNLRQGVHPMPWPWLTGYITIATTWIGGYSPPPIQIVNNQYTLEENLYTGIIQGLRKR